MDLPLSFSIVLDPKWQFHVLTCMLLVQPFRAVDVLSALPAFPHESAAVYLSDPKIVCVNNVRKILQTFRCAHHVNCARCLVTFCILKMDLPQRNLENCRHPDSRESFSRVVACRREANMGLDHVERIMPKDLVADTASFL